MVDKADPVTASELRRVREDVTKLGYALTTEWDIGLPLKCGRNLREVYFEGGQLRCDKDDQPADRERARDVIRYEWKDGELILEEYETIAIWDRSGIKGERIHKRINVLQDGQFRELVETFLSLVPEDRRQLQGTFGINLFRTHTNVVTKPHRDEEEFIILYVLAREGDGAESYLYQHDKKKMDSTEDGDLVFQQQLNAGDLLIFDDKQFKHGATPLTPPGGRAKRDVLVCTVDYPTTYLWPDPVS
jgi:2OG-Fe dioxygenase